MASETARLFDTFEQAAGYRVTRRSSAGHDIAACLLWYCIGGEFTEHEPISHLGFIAELIKVRLDAAAWGSKLQLGGRVIHCNGNIIMRIAHLLAVAAMAGSLSAASVSSSQAAGACRSDMMHLMGMHACSQRLGCLRTHLQMLSKGCLTKLSFRASQRLKMRHKMG